MRKQRVKKKIRWQHFPWRLKHRDEYDQFFYRICACSVLYFCPLKTKIDACVIFQTVKLSFFSVFILYSGFPEERPELKFRLRFFSFVPSQIAIKSSSRATFWGMSTWHGVMADNEKLSRCKISTDTVYNTLKTHTKYAHIVRGRPTLKDVERFRNG